MAPKIKPLPKDIVINSLVDLNGEAVEVLKQPLPEISIDQLCSYAQPYLTEPPTADEVVLCLREDVVRFLEDSLTSLEEAYASAHKIKSVSEETLRARASIQRKIDMYAPNTLPEELQSARELFVENDRVFQTIHVEFEKQFFGESFQGTKAYDTFILLSHSPKTILRQFDHKEKGGDERYVCAIKHDFVEPLASCLTLAYSFQTQASKDSTALEHLSLRNFMLGIHGIAIMAKNPSLYRKMQCIPERPTVRN